MDKLKQTIENFLSHLRIERRLSSNTTDSYQRDLSSLIEWMPSAGFADWQSLNGEALRSFMASNIAVVLAQKVCSEDYRPAVRYFNGS